MPTSSKIDFASNATTREALFYSIKYSVAFWRSLWRDTNAFAHRLPWLCILLALTVSSLTGFILVGSARAERDAAAKRMAKMQEQIEQLSCALEARKEAAR